MSVCNLLSMEIVKVCPSELELSEVHTNINCPESGCTSIFPNTSSLEMHLIKIHSKDSSFLEKKVDNRVYQYFCPVKFCKYEMDKERPENQLRWFKKHKYLKQHYQWVHKEKKFKCSLCGKRFMTMKEKERHCSTDCGVKFTCLSCSFMYNTQEGLEAHYKRKHSINMSGGKHVQSVKPSLMKASAGSNNSWASTSTKKECAILPNPIENIAAAALSELSWKIVVKGVDKGVQTSGRKRTPIRSLKRKDSQQTQTGDKQPKVSQETQTTSSYKNRPRPSTSKDTLGMETQTGLSSENRLDSTKVSGEPQRLGTETQTFHDLFPEFSNSSQNPLDDVILPQLYTSSTQTGDQSLFNIKKELGLDLFEDEANSRGYNDHIDRLIQSSILESKSCNIETQTEIDNGETFIEPILSNTETQTIQNAFDDYSHNYTQTCDDILLNDFVEFSDIETQTAWANLGVDFVSAETQTIF